MLGQTGISKLRYRVVSPGPTLQESFHSSTGHFFREEIMPKGLQPDGVRFIGGGDDFIDVAYEPDIVSREQIEEFIESFGIQAQHDRSSG